jgi:hypothetical protein
VSLYNRPSCTLNESFSRNPSLCAMTNSLGRLNRSLGVLKLERCRSLVSMLFYNRLESRSITSALDELVLSQRYITHAASNGTFLSIHVSTNCLLIELSSHGGIPLILSDENLNHMRTSATPPLSLLHLAHPYDHNPTKHSPTSSITKPLTYRHPIYLSKLVTSPPEPPVCNEKIKN